LFAYDGGELQDYFFPETALEGTGIKLSASTVPNGEGKPNEDSFAIVLNEDVLWIGVFDGTTSLRPLEKLKGVTGARFASGFLKNHFPQSDFAATPKNLLLSLNTGLLQEAVALGGDLADTHSLPAAMATVLKIDLKKMTLEFAHVGDTWVVVYGRDGRSDLITEDRNKKFDDEMFALLVQSALERGISLRLAREEDNVKLAVYEMYQRRNNNPDGSGSGLINGDPQVEKYIQTGIVDLSEKMAVLAGTDGLEIQGRQLTDSVYRDFLMKNYLEGGFEKLINLKRESEDADPDWVFTRFKHSDDATGIMVKL